MVNFTFSFFETLIQELVTHCYYYLVRECYVLQSLLQNCTCPHRQGGATGCQPSMAASFRMKRPTHCRQWDVQVLVSVDISITKDKITDSEAMHSFTTESGRNVVAYGWMTTLSTSPDDVLSADIGALLLDVGLFVSGMAINHRFCKLASARGWWKLTDRHCLDCPDEPPKSIRKCFFKNTLFLRGPTQIYMNPSL